MRTFDTYECYTQYTVGRKSVRNQLDDVGTGRKPLSFRAGANYDPERHSVGAPAEETRKGDETAEGVRPEAAGEVAIEYRSISR